MADTKLITFLQKSLSSPLRHSLLYRKFIFDTALSLACLPRCYFKILLLLLSSYSQSALFCFFLLKLFSFVSSTAPTSCQSNTLMLKQQSSQLFLLLPVWTSLPAPPAFMYQIQFLSLHAKPLGRNPRIVPLPCSYNYMKHLSNLVQ